MDTLGAGLLSVAERCPYLGDITWFYPVHSTDCCLSIVVAIISWPELFELILRCSTRGTHVEPRILLYEGVWL